MLVIVDENHGLDLQISLQPSDCDFVTISLRGASHEIAGFSHWWAGADDSQACAELESIIWGSFSQSWVVLMKL